MRIGIITLNDFYNYGNRLQNYALHRFIENLNCNHVVDTIWYSKCEKCQRTMMELYVLGKLEKYKEVFDFDYFSRNKRRFLRTSSINRYKDDWKEVYEILDSQDELGILEKILFIRKMISKKLSLKKFFEKKRK